MAFDESLARSCDKNKEQFFLRFYNWGDEARPAMTFGYAQFFDEIQKEMLKNNFRGQFTRRPTGGGVVYHDGDLTFSCVFTSDITRPNIIYNKLHGAINKKLEANMFAPALFAPAGYAPSKNETASACFSSPVPDDIMDDGGKKILGGAIRRFDNIVLYQGSLQMPGARGRTHLINSIKQAVEEEWDAETSDLSFSEHYINNIKRNAVSLYKSDGWNKKF